MVYQSSVTSFIKDQIAQARFYFNPRPVEFVCFYQMETAAIIPLSRCLRVPFCKSVWMQFWYVAEIVLRELDEVVVV